MELQSGRPNFKNQRWIILSVLVITPVLAAYIARAQELTPSPEPITVPADISLVTLIPTDELLLEDGSLSATPIAPAAVETSLFPTGTPATMLIPTDESTIEVTDFSATLVTPQPTILPTDTPSPTLSLTNEVVVTSIPSNINIAASMTRLSEGTLLTLTVSAEGLTDVYNVVAACRVDPNILLGAQATSGDMLPADISTVTDGGFQADGSWMLISRQVDSAPPVVSSGTLWTFNYQVVGTAGTQISCQTRIGDRDNQALPLANANLVLTIEGYQDATEVVLPTLLANETDMPLTPEATEVQTATPMNVTAVSPLSDQFHISGQIEANLPLKQAAVTIKGATVNQVIVVQNNGTFSADLPAGDYQFIFTALYCLPRVIPVTIASKPMRLPLVILTGGDVDGNGVIDMADVMLITQNFGRSASLTLSSADLNGDGVVNIYDLTLVSASITASP